MISSLTLPPLPPRYGVWMKPNSDTVANDASEPMRPMFGTSGVSIRHMPPYAVGWQCARPSGRARRAHVPHPDGRALARQPSGAERREAPSVREARERVRLIHELRQL